MNRRRRSTASLAMVAHLITLSVVVARVDAAANDTVASVVKAWKARQDHTRTVRFEWDETRTLSAAMTPRRWTLEERKRVESLPDIVHKRHLAICLDGEMVRYERHGQEWSADVADFVPGSYVGVFDGKTPKSLSRFDRTGKLGCSALGYIYKDSRHPDYRDTTIWPILLAYRPFSPDLGRVDPARLSVSIDQGVVSGRACALITQPLTQSTLRRTYWVDPGREYVILRLTEEKDRRGIFACDISYQRDDASGWVPSGWTTVVTASNGKAALQFVAHVTRHEIDQPIADREFQIEFPAGTMVVDDVAKSTFIVRDGGDKRFVSPRERAAGIPIEQLSASKADEDMQPQGHLRLYLSLSALAVLSAAVLFAYVRRRTIREGHVNRT